MQTKMRHWKIISKVEQVVLYKTTSFLRPLKRSMLINVPNNARDLSAKRTFYVTCLAGSNGPQKIGALLKTWGRRVQLPVSAIGQWSWLDFLCRREESKCRWQMVLRPLDRTLLRLHRAYMSSVEQIRSPQPSKQRCRIF